MKITVSIPQKFEELQGLVNGANLAFHTSQKIDTAKVVLIYVNGMQRYLGEDFDITGDDEITFYKAPAVQGAYKSKVKIEYYPSL